MITTSSKGPSLAAVVRGDEVQVGNALVGVAKAQELSVRNGGVVALLAGENAELNNGYCQHVLAGESARVSKAAAAAIVAGGEMQVMDAGAALMVAGNGMSMERAGAAAIVAGKADIRGGYVGLVVSGKTAVSDGARVLLGTREALIMGVVCALLLRLFGLGGKKKSKRR